MEAEHRRAGRRPIPCIALAFEITVETGNFVFSSLRYFLSGTCSSEIRGRTSPLPSHGPDTVYKVCVSTDSMVSLRQGCVAHSRGPRSAIAPGWGAHFAGT